MLKIVENCGTCMFRTLWDYSDDESSTITWSATAECAISDKIKLYSKDQNEVHINCPLRKENCTFKLKQ